MFERTIQNSDLKARLDIVGTRARAPESCLWLRALVSALESLHNSDASSTMIHRTLCHLPTSTPRLRWELSRIPVLHEIDRQWLLEGRRHVSCAGIWHNGKFYTVGNAICPESVFWQYEHKKDSLRGAVWCFYAPNDTSSIYLPKLETWSETDSIVDWIGLFVDNPYTYSAQIRSVDEEIHCRISDNRTASENILDFITEHAPVNTARILEQNFAGSRHVYKILRKLQFADKIERIQHGLYTAISE